MTTQLEEALKGFPLYSQDGKGKEAICRAIFALGHHGFQQKPTNDSSSVT